MKELKPTKKSRIYEIIMLGICILICAGAFVFGVWSLNSITSNFDTSGQISFKGFAGNYTQIDYIQSYGSQYIDTGVEYDNSVKVEIDFKPNTISTASYALNIVIFGNTNDEANSFQVHYDEDVYSAGYYRYSEHAKSTFEALPVRTSAIITSTSAVVTTEQKSASLENWEIGEIVGGTIKLLHQFENNIVKIYSCKIYKNNKLVRDYIPCYKNSTDENGLYDIVNNTFTTSATSTGFAREIPADYFTYKVAGITLANPQGTNEKIDMAYITGMTKTWDKDYFVLPEKLGGYEVFSLEFENSTTLNSSIYIMPNSFAWWASASGVDLLTFGNSQVKLISPHFWYLSETNLNKVTEAFVIDDVTAGTFRTTTGARFKGATNLSKVRFANNTYEISDNAFKDCTSLSDIELPLRLLSIRDNAFQNCSGLQSISIPRYTRYISSSAFSNTANLKIADFGQVSNWIRSSGTADKYEQVNSLGAYDLHSGKSLSNKCVFTFEGDTITGLDSNYSYLTEITIPLNYYYASSSKDSTTGRYSFYDISAFSSIGDSAFKDNTTITKVKMSSDPTYVSSNITSLGAESFRGCTALKTVEFPGTGNHLYFHNPLETIGTWAFGGCSSLTDFPFEKLPSLTTLGDSCFNFTALTDAEFNDEAPLSTIENAIFYSVESLKTVQLNSNIKTISNNMFYNCNALTSVTGGDAVVSIGENAFSPAAGTGALATCEPLLSGNLQTINAYAFNNQPLLEYSDLTFSSNLANIKKYAFNGCAKLTGSINLESTQLTEISDGAFGGCSNLTSITLPSALKAIGAKAFASSGLISITIPLATNSIGAYAFENCADLEYISMAHMQSYFNWQRQVATYDSDSDSYTSSGTIYSAPYLNSASDNATYFKSTYVSSAFTYDVAYTYTEKSGELAITGLQTNYANLTTLYIPAMIEGKYVTSIGGFKNKTAITNVYLPESNIGGKIKQINSSAFESCTYLMHIDMPTTLTIIGSYAFNKCARISDISLSRVTSIGNYAFNGCSRLSVNSINSAINLTQIGNYAFYNAFYDSFSFSSSTLAISSSVQHIGQNAFGANASSSLVKSVRFDNTKYWYVTNSSETIGFDESKISSSGSSSATSANATLLTQTYVGYEWTRMNNSSIYTYTTSGTEATITGITTAFKTVITTASIPASVTGAKTYTVVAIADSAFNGLSNITSTSIPSTVVQIGKNAYKGTKITSASFVDTLGWCVKTSSTGTSNPINLSSSSSGNATYLKSTYTNYYWEKVANIFTYSVNSDNTTASITGLVDKFANVTRIVIPKSIDGYTITAIADSAFASKKLQDVEISSSSLLSIGNKAFQGCPITTIDFYGATNLKTIGDFAFSGCKFATLSLRYNTSLTYVGDAAFHNNSALKTAYMPYNLTNNSNYEKSTFNSCTSLQTVYLSENMTEICNTMFYGCSSLSKIGIVKSDNSYADGNLLNITSIAASAFENCSSLTSFTFPSSLKTISGYAFKRSGLKGDTLDLSACTKLTEIPIMCFFNLANNTGFTTVKLPTSIKVIAEKAFYNNTSLTSINLKELTSLETIGVGAFNYCSSLTDVYIPSGVTSIGYTAFANTGLQTANFANRQGWAVRQVDLTTNQEGSTVTGLDIETLANSDDAEFGYDYREDVAKYLKSTYYDCNWTLETVFTYEINSDFEGITITGLKDYFKNIQYVTINDDEDGYRPTRIADNAFSNNSYIQHFIISSDDLHTIGAYAFNNCTLYDLHIFKSNIISTIGDYAFANVRAGTLDFSIMTQLRTIGNYAFSGCTYTTVDLRNSTVLYSIGMYAFSSNSFLKTVYMPYNFKNYTSLSIFNGCQNLTSVYLSQATTSIAAEMFFNCPSLSTVGIVQSNKAYTTGTLTSLTSIGSRAFEGCGSLASFGFSSTIESLGAKAFLNAGLTGTTLDLSACTKLTAIPEGCFYQIGASTGYQTVKLPTSIKTIGDEAFLNNKSLTTLDLSAMVNLETISQFAFSGCSFTTLNLSNSTKLTYVGNAAFHNNAGLTIAYMPYNLTSYAASTFNTCPNLTTAYLSENLTEICFAMFFSCTNLSKLGITKSNNYCYDGNFTKVTKIGEQAFEGCSSLTNWYFPNVETISNRAFINCSSFTEINFGSNLTSIGTSAFQFCSGLTTIYIPATIEEIGTYAFHKCTSLFLANTDTSIAGPYIDFDLSKCTKLKIISHSSFAETGIGRLIIPINVNTIDPNAFFNCTSLKYVNWRGNSSELTVNTGAFTAAPLTKFEMPNISFSSYYWMKYDSPDTNTLITIASGDDLIEFFANSNTTYCLKALSKG